MLSPPYSAARLPLGAVGNGIRGGKGASERRRLAERLQSSRLCQTNPCAHADCPPAVLCLVSQLRFDNPTAALWWEVVNHSVYVLPKIRHEVYQLIDETDQIVTAFKELGGQFVTNWIDDVWQRVLKFKDILGSCAKRYRQLHPGNKLPGMYNGKYIGDFYHNLNLLFACMLVVSACSLLSATRIVPTFGSRAQVPLCGPLLARATRVGGAPPPLALERATECASAHC